MAFLPLERRPETWPPLVPFVFILPIERTANKVQIKKDIETLYGVTVTDINTMRTIGKIKSKGTKGGQVSGRRSNGKKAIVTVKEGDVIDFYSNL